MRLKRWYWIERPGMWWVRGHWTSACKNGASSARVLNDAKKAWDIFLKMPVGTVLIKLERSGQAKARTTEWVKGS